MLDRTADRARYAGTERLRQYARLLIQKGTVQMLILALTELCLCCRCRILYFRIIILNAQFFIICQYFLQFTDVLLFLPLLIQNTGQFFPVHFSIRKFPELFFTF